MEYRDLKLPWTDPTDNLFQWALQNFQYAKAFYRDWHEACEDELDFSHRLAHYVNDSGNTRSKRTLMKGVELFNLLRHKSAQTSKVRSFIDVVPRNPEDDTADERASVMKRTLEYELFNPLKRYSKNRRKMVNGAMAARGWGMAIEAADFRGRVGLAFRLVESTRLWPCPGFSDIHDVYNPWVMEELVFRTEDLYRTAVEREWDNVDKISPDGSTPDDPRPVGLGNPRGIVPSGPPSRGRFQSEYTTVVAWWIKHDPTKKYVNEKQRGPQDDEPVGMCEACGKTYTKEQMDSVLARSCVKCGGEIVGTVFREAEVVPAFPNGRLIIFAPELGIVLHDGEWPYDVSSFPFMWLSSYEHPREFFSQSDTSLYWSLQVMMNRLRLFGYNQMMNTPDILIAPFNGLVDSKKRPFVYSDEQGRVAYFTNMAEAQYIRHFQGAGLPAAWPTLYGSLSSDFWRTDGTSDQGLSPQSSRKIPVGTLQRLIESGELPVDELVSRLQEEESIGFTVGADMIASIYAEGQRIRSQNPDGSYRSEDVSSENLTRADVIVTGQPTLREIKQDEFDAMANLMKLPPWLRRAAAKSWGISTSWVRQIEADEQSYMAQQNANPAAAGAGAPNGGPQDDAQGMQQYADALGLS